MDNKNDGSFIPEERTSELTDSIADGLLYFRAWMTKRGVHPPMDALLLFAFVDEVGGAAVTPLRRLDERWSSSWKAADKEILFFGQTQAEALWGLTKWLARWESVTENARQELIRLQGV